MIDGGGGNDILYGESALDAMTGGLGADIFVFQAASAYSNIDTVSDFSTAQGDPLNLVDLLGVCDPLTEAITDFVQITTSGGNSNVALDRDGTAGVYSFTQIATLTGVTGLTDEAALVTSGNLIAASSPSLPDFRGAPRPSGAPFLFAHFQASSGHGAQGLRPFRLFSVVKASIAPRISLD